MDKKVRVASIKTSYSRETYCYFEIKNGMFGQNGLAECLMESCFCDNYKVVSDREATSKETERFLFALSKADDNHLILQVDASRYALNRKYSIDELLANTTY